ncbi:MAG TPA: DUF5683 domain-containing protein [Saprospiraceae bacterium]|nr:DUF5683 domain-containing protein [Saprospiraceae bacterium]
MRTLFLLFGFFLSITLRAQQPDSASTLPARDSVVSKKAAKMQARQQPAVARADTAGTTILLPDTILPAGTHKQGFVGRFFTKKYPDPRKAALLSVVLPGAGQMYNRKWWKLPIVYAGLGGLTWLEIRNANNYREARDNYKWLVDGDPNTNVIPDYEGVDATSLKNYRDVLRRYLEQSSLILGLAYLLTATDAYVDAHLSRFDVSEDLSMKVIPSTQSTYGMGLAFGVGVQLEFGGPKKPNKPVPMRYFIQP